MSKKTKKFIGVYRGSGGGKKPKNTFRAITNKFNNMITNRLTPCIAVPVDDNNWILANGVWNDNGVWVDSEVWNDG